MALGSDTKKVLILGGSGMLGHKLWQLFSRRFDTHVTLRQFPDVYARSNLFDLDRAEINTSTQELDGIIRVIRKIQPSVVVNCIGIVKQDAAAKDAVTSISVNALFPHRLAQLCRMAGIRLIHISTDCVFSGRKGNYKETDETDATDLYGRSKLLGEIDYDGCLTLRTSMIGRELTGSHGLLEWFFSQQGKRVRGYRRAVFSGFTTNALAEVIASIIEEHAELHGVWHVAAEPISKYELLSLIKQIYELNIEIEIDETFECDRSLDATQFRQATRFIPPSWRGMLLQMHQDKTPYTEFRRQHAHG